MIINLLMRKNPDFNSLSEGCLATMLAAGEDIQECYRLLKKAGRNAVGQVLALREGDVFYEWDHYPDGDVYDDETHSQYYYHAHRGTTGEHGHYHTFLRKKGMPASVEPAPYDGLTERPSGNDALAHFIAISMDPPGFPIGLFTTNRWVTGETYYAADDVIAMLDRFRIDHAYPCHVTNRWITSMIALFRPQIEDLLYQRDAKIAGWEKLNPGSDVYEDRDLEITSQMKVDVKKQISAVKTALRERRRAT